MSGLVFVFFTTVSLIFGSVLGQQRVPSEKTLRSAMRHPIIRSPMIQGSTSGQPIGQSPMFFESTPATPKISESTTGQSTLRSPTISKSIMGASTITGSTTGQPSGHSPNFSEFALGTPNIFKSTVGQSTISGSHVTNTVQSSTASSSSIIPACNSIVSELNPCVGYVGKIEAKPSDTCCAGVKSLKQYNKNKAARQAICRCLESVAPMLGQIDYSLLTGLPKKCGVSVKLPAVTSPNYDCSKA